MFWTMFQQHYSGDPPQNKSWYGVLNIVLSIGCLTATQSVYADFQKHNPGPPEAMAELSWRYFQSACSTFLDAVFMGTDLMGVQTVIGMVSFACRYYLGHNVNFC